MALEYHSGKLFRLFAVATAIAILLPAAMLSWFVYQRNTWSDVAFMYRKSAEEFAVKYEEDSIVKDLHLSMFKISKEHMDDALKISSEYEDKKDTSFKVLVFTPASLVLIYYALVFIVTGIPPHLPRFRRAPR